MWLELDGLRVVHACWDQQAIESIAAFNKQITAINADYLQEACKKQGSLYPHVEVVLKGKEARLPEGASFRDKDGHERKDVRTRWYLPAHGHTYRSYAFQNDPVDCDSALGDEIIAQASPYPENAKPVFIGHYWLVSAQPELLAKNVACLDYSVAKGGFLCAYRWSGEQQLNSNHFVWAS